MQSLRVAAEPRVETRLAEDFLTSFLLGGFAMLGSFLSLAAVVGLALAEAAPAQPIHVGGEKQLFLGPWAEDGRDDYLVESMRNVAMTMNEARVTGERMIRHDRPWDRSDCWLSVLKDGDVFRMYYGSRESTDALRRGDPYSIILLYAESRDGIHWERPNLGLWEWEGSARQQHSLPQR